MKRRTFIKGVGAVAVAPKALAEPNHEYWLYNGVSYHEHATTGTVITHGTHPPAMWPGIDKWFTAHYKDNAPQYKEHILKTKERK